MKIEDHPAFKNELPRICYVLGGEKTPLKVGEHFNYAGHECFISEDGNIVCTNFLSVAVLPDWVSEIFNHPEKIILRPQFSDDEKALMRLFVEMKYPWIARDISSGNILAYENEPRKAETYFYGDGKYESIPNKFLPQITWENSPFNAAEYLEGLK